MKSVVISAILLPLLAGLTVEPARAQWRIELQNGNHIIVDLYWREEGQIQFVYHGGKAGISEDFVADIVSAPTEDNSSKVKTNDATHETFQWETPDSLSMEARFKEELLNICAELLELADQYAKAASDQDNVAAGRVVRETERYHRNKEMLRQQVLHANHNSLPEWWEDIASMETEYRSRSVAGMHAAGRR